MNSIAIIGAGVVGLELALHLSKFNKVQLFDINQERIENLKQALDINQLVDSHTLKESTIEYCFRLSDLQKANIFIVVVPTDISPNQPPDLEPLKKATQTLASLLKSKDIVIYESTVYPRTTESILIPILEKYSGLKLNQDFYVAYSPERFSPHDEPYQLEKTCKVFSTSHPCISKKVESLYSKVCANTYMAPNIAVAECCKILENIQRNINIALMNEFSKITHALDISLHEVIKASATKTNFHVYSPGFVGGYCLPVNLRYMIYQALQHHVKPTFMEAAQSVNESMPEFVFNQFLKLYFLKLKNKHSPKIGIFGLSFKPNIPDIRHSLNLDLINIIKNFGFDVLIHDPLYQGSIAINDLEDFKNLDVCFLLVKHQFYHDLGLDYFLRISNSQPIIMDIAHLFVDAPKPNDLCYWTL